jgi:Tfp pilus assembly protein PilW
MRRARGLTLLELIIAMAIMMLGIAAAGMLLLAASRTVRTAETALVLEDSARLGMDAILRPARIAGFGSPGGVFVKNGADPAAKLVNPVFGLDGTTGVGQEPAQAGPVGNQTDDLWFIVPENNVMGVAGTDRFAATTLATAAPASTSPLAVSNTGGFAVGDLLLVSNTTSSALITVVAPLTADTTNAGVHTAGGLSYAEKTLTGFAPSKVKAFQANDMVFGARLVHFYIGASAGQPALIQETGALGTDAYGRPFVSGANVQTYAGIEDLQVAYLVDPGATNDPNQFVAQNGLVPTYTPGVRALRISVVARSAAVARDTDGKVRTGAAFMPVAVENHASTGVVDGFARSLYQRRVELPNLAPGVL